MQSQDVGLTVGSGGEGWKGGDLNLKVVDEARSAREDNLICSRACQGLVSREVALWHKLLIAGMGGARPASLGWCWSGPTSIHGSYHNTLNVTQNYRRSWRNEGLGAGTFWRCAACSSCMQCALRSHSPTTTDLTSLASRASQVPQATKPAFDSGENTQTSHHICDNPSALSLIKDPRLIAAPTTTSDRRLISCSASPRLHLRSRRRTRNGSFPSQPVHTGTKALSCAPKQNPSPVCGQ